MHYRKSAYEQWPIRLELIPVSVAWSDEEYFHSPLEGMLVHRRVTTPPSIKFAVQWAERGTAIVECLAQEHVPGQCANQDRSIQRRAH